LEKVAEALTGMESADRRGNQGGRSGRLEAEARSPGAPRDVASGEIPETHADPL